MKTFLTAALLMFTVSTAFAQQTEDPLPLAPSSEKSPTIQKSYGFRNAHGETGDSKTSYGFRNVLGETGDSNEIGTTSDVAVQLLAGGQMVVSGSKESVEAFQREVQSLAAKTEIETEIKTYRLKYISAEYAAAVFEMLNIAGIDSIFAGQNNSLIAKANVEGAKQVEFLLEEIDVAEDRNNVSVERRETRPEMIITLYSLEFIPAKEAVAMLKQLNFTNVKVNTKTNSVIHRADESDSKQVKKLLELLDTKSVGPAKSERDDKATLGVVGSVGLQAQYEQSERKAAELAAQLREARADDNPKRVRSISDPLRREVEQAFKLRIQIQQSELDEAEAALKASRDRLARRQQIADAIITRRIQEFESSDDMTWSGSGMGASMRLEQESERNALGGLDSNPVPVSSLDIGDSNSPADAVNR